LDGDSPAFRRHTGNRLAPGPAYGCLVAAGRRRRRRWGLAVSVLLIGIAILAIRFLIRRIEARP
jgi:hypothetical protein